MKITLLVLLCLFMENEPDFLTRQKKYPRVKNAYREKETLLKQRLEKAGLSFDNIHILITAYKQEGILTIYAKAPTDREYKQISTYRVCARSGHLGPKRRQGDHQVPEGFYHINHFNPTSNYHLSLMINYPNSSDRLKSKAPNLGGSICIHGNCVTVGCLPMTDDKIKEIYLYAVQARQCGQKVFPSTCSPSNSRTKKCNNTRMPTKPIPTCSLSGTIYEKVTIYLSKELKELNITVDRLGNYLFTK